MIIDTKTVPELSVIAVAQSPSSDLRHLIDDLNLQSRSNDLEFIVVTPAGCQDLFLDEVSRANSFLFRVVGVPDLISLGYGKARGVRAAQAPLVAFVESHCHLEPEWAEVIISTHDSGDFAAVGPSVRNANPDTAVSWGSFLVFYGPWMDSRVAQNMEHLPGNQSCYRREILMLRGQNLTDDLESESLFHWDLVTQGFKLRFEPSAVVAHKNHIQLGMLLKEHYLASRIFASLRTRGRPAFKKLVFAFGSPLIPLIRMHRLVREICVSGFDFRILWRALTPTVLNLCVGAVGEMMGYAFGEGGARRKLVDFEAVRDGMLPKSPSRCNQHLPLDCPRRHKVIQDV